METKEFLLVASVNNRVAVLNKVTAAFLKRHINIESLSVSESPVDGVSSMVISAHTTEETMRRLTAHLDSVYDVVHAAYYHSEDLVHQELALYKIEARSGGDVLRSLPRRDKGRVIERNDDYIIVEKSGSRAQLESLRQTLESRKVLEGYSRSGNVVIHKDRTEDLREDARLSLAV